MGTSHSVLRLRARRDEPHAKLLAGEQTARSMSRHLADRDDGLTLELRGSLVEALRKEVRADVVGQLEEQWKAQMMEDLREELVVELLPRLRAAIREEVASAISALPQAQAANASFTCGRPKSRSISRNFGEGPLPPSGAIADIRLPIRMRALSAHIDGPGAVLIRQATGLLEEVDDRMQIVMFTDMGGVAHDSSDTVALFLLRGLEGLGFIETKAVIVGGIEPRRLELSVKTITQIINDLHFESKVSVGVCLEGSYTELPLQFQKSQDVGLCEEVLVSTLEQAADNSIVFVITCITTNLAFFLQRNGHLAAEKLKHVAIFGTVCDRVNGDLLRTAAQNDDKESTYIRPDPSHAPFAADMKTVDYVFSRLQDLGIAIVMTSRFTAYAGPVNASLYDDLAWTNNGVARRLRSQQLQAIQDLWNRVNQPPGSTLRMGLPDRCTPTWFAKTMCGGRMPNGQEDVWPSITSFFMYDSIAIISAVPDLRERIFSQDEVHQYHCVNERTNLVYGQNEDLCGIVDKKKLTDLLQDAALSGLSVSPDPYPIIIFTDPGQDLDDEMTLILLASLTERKYVRPIAVVANLYPSFERALLAKGTLNKLGLSQVPVAVGTDGGTRSNKDTFSETAFAYLPDESQVERDAEALLRRVLIGEENASVLVLCISSLTDAAAFLRNNESLFVEKAREVHSVTIMGGVDLSQKDAQLAEEVRHGQEDSETNPLTAATAKETLKPDTANNNTFDMPSAVFLYTRLQELCVKTNVLTRFAAYGCPLPRSIYDTMQKTGSPIALRLFDVQRKSIEELWKRCNATGEERKGLPPRCSKEWYMKTFLGNRGEDRTEKDSIWDLVLQFNMYDPMALILAVPPLAWVFFDDSSSREKIQHQSLELRVIGTSPENPGIKRHATLREFMIDNLVEGVARPLRNERQHRDLFLTKLAV